MFEVIFAICFGLFFTKVNYDEVRKINQGVVNDTIRLDEYQWQKYYKYSIYSYYIIETCVMFLFLYVLVTSREHQDILYIVGAIYVLSIALKQGILILIDNDMKSGMEDRFSKKSYWLSLLLLLSGVVYIFYSTQSLNEILIFTFPLIHFSTQFLALQIRRRIDQKEEAED